MRWLRSYSPALLFGAALLGLWEWLVAHYDVPAYVLPAPHLILHAAQSQAAELRAAAWITIQITAQALFWAVTLGLGLAILFTRARLVERVLYPYVVILQVTPVVAIAPLVLIWVGFDNVNRALVIIAWIVAFFPILTNAVSGLRAVDPNLRDLFKLYNATPLQTLLKLELPSALPQILTGVKISGGLALIGAIVAEFVAGSGNSTGLAWRIIETGNRLDIAGLFASLLLLSGIGIGLFYLLSLAEWLSLRKWHPAYQKQGNG
jgi:NitT/TauT family transport system permease protein